MKIKCAFMVWLLISLLEGTSIAQNATSYKVPDAYRFDYEVTQMISDRKNGTDSSLLHFLYTKNGDYAAANISRNAVGKGNLFLVITREGMTVVFDEQNKTITVVSIRKLISDLSGLLKWVRMDSLMAHFGKKSDGRDFQSVRTGNKKEVDGYASEEYTITDNRGQTGSIWITKVDFNTQGDYLMSALGGNWLQMAGGKLSSHPMLQALTQPMSLVTSIHTLDSSGNHGMDLRTLTIRSGSNSISTSGYTVNDYSNMTLPEIFQAEMKRRNNSTK